MEVSFLPERTFGCSLLDDCALPWRRLTASFARVVQSAKSDDGATYGPALLCRGEAVIKKWPSFNGYGPVVSRAQGRSG